MDDRRWMMALTGNLIVRQQIILVGFLKHFQTQYIERPLIWKVLFQGSDFPADGNGTYDGSVVSFSMSTFELFLHVITGRAAGGCNAPSALEAPETPVVTIGSLAMLMLPR